MVASLCVVCCERALRSKVIGVFEWGKCIRCNNIMQKLTKWFVVSMSERRHSVVWFPICTLIYVGWPKCGVDGNSLIFLTDVNECIHRNHSCQQRCQNIAGSFKCVCEQGYKLNTDARTCDGKCERS